MIKYITTKEKYEKEVKEQLKNRDMYVLDIEKIKNHISIRHADNLLGIKSSIGKNTYKKCKNIIKILERDNYSCQKCGCKTNLTIHHPDGRKFARYNNYQKYKPDKCITLCKECHLEEHIGVVLL